jgi:hypothetical protein
MLWLASQAPWPAGQVERPPPPWPSNPHVDMCPRSRGLNQHRTWPAGQAVCPVGRPLRPFGVGFGPLGTCLKYTHVMMMILTFSQLYLIIP